MDHASSLSLRQILLEYVNEVNPHLECGICYSAFIDPYMTPCKHYFCYDCIKDALAIQLKCPIDRLSLTLENLEKAPKIINDMTDELEVRCPFKKFGCEEIFSRAQILGHVNSCQFKEHTEENSDCKNLISCKHCNELISDCVRHSLECIKYPIKCRCSLFGCEWEGLRSELEKHELECNYLPLEPLLHQQESRIKHLELVNRQLQVKILELEQQVSFVVKELGDRKILNENQNRQEDNPTALMLETFMLEQRRMRAEIIRLNSSMTSLDLKHEAERISEINQMSIELEGLRDELRSFRNRFDNLREGNSSGNINQLSQLSDLVKGAQRRGRPASFVLSSKF